MRLYHVPGTRSNRVLWALEETGLPHETVTIAREDRQTPAHLERHPLGRVPVVHDGTGYVFESAGIVMQIADLAPQSGMLPPLGSHERALAYQWILFAMIEMEVPIVINYVHGANGVGEKQPERAAAAIETYRKAAAVVEQELASKEYILGGGFTFADLIVAGVLVFGAWLGMNDGFTNIAAYLERVHARPAYQRAHA